VEKVEWNPFFDGNVVIEQKKLKWVPIVVTGSMIILRSSAVLAATSTPAGAAGSLAKLMTEMLAVGDYIAWGMLIFAGVSWMFGNKTVAVERAVGVTAGYLIIRKSWDYVMFLKGI
jgi:hypothetical protein